MTKKVIIFLLILISLSAGGLVFFYLNSQSLGIISPLGQFKIKPEPTPKPLEKYSFANLKKRGGKASEIKLERELSKNSASASTKVSAYTKVSADKSADKSADRPADRPEFTSYLFSYLSDGRKVTGLLNLPQGKGPFPVIVMLRGYVDREIYETGVGTQHAGEYFAQNGFITLAPDFLGYGESEMPPNNVWEERFLRLTSVLDLLASIKNLKQANPNSIGIWGHSNGGLLALSILEISGAKYPTTLWAPVSQNFPYDILYYTYEYDDKGKALRQSLADFEKDYDVSQYSFDNYLDWIEASIQIHQGTSDEYIPLWWTDNLVEKLKKLDKLDKQVNLYIYPGADHNLKGGWEIVVQRDVQFFRKQLK